MALRLKSRGKGKKGEPLLLRSLTKCELGDSTNSSAVNKALSSRHDPYDFVDSQSLQPETSVAVTPRREGERSGKRITPPSRKKQLTPVTASRKSPAVVKEDQLRQREKEELELALEESRREAAREERRRRQQRREEAEAVEEATQRVRVAEEIQSSSRKIDEALTALSAAQSLTEVPITPTVGVDSSAGHCDDDLSQSTPPLCGGHTSGTPHSAIRRTPILQVTKLPHSGRSGKWRDGGSDRGGREWLEDTPPLVEEGEMGREEGEGKRRVGEDPEQVGEVPLAAASREESDSREPRRHSLLLSLRRGKKRMSSSETGHSPSSKKTRLSSGASERQESEAAIASHPPPQPDVPGSALKANGREEDIVPGTGRKTTPPEMFAPRGADPAAYTTTILRVLNSYIHQLRLAQEKIKFRELWSRPVPTYHRQPQTTLSYRYSQSRHHSRPAAAGVTWRWPTIDLGTGEVSQWSPETDGRGPTNRSRRSKRNTSFIEEDSDFVFPSMSLTRTPKRPQLSTRCKSVRQDVFHQPSLNDIHHSPNLDSTPPESEPHTSVTESEPHSGPPESERHIGITESEPHTGVTESEPHSGPPESELGTESEENDVCYHNSASEQPSSVTPSVPPPPPVPPPLPPPVPAATATVAPDRSSQIHGTVPLTGSGDQEREEEAAGCVLSSEEVNSEVGSLSRRRKRTAHILDDSASETDDISRKESANDDAIPAKHSSDSSETTGLDMDTSKQKPRTLAPFGRGKRLKRFTFERLAVKSVRGNKPQPSSSSAVIDLTADHISDTAPSPPPSLSPTPSPSLSRVLRRRRTEDAGQQVSEEEEEEEEEVEEERVVCPLCGERFARSLIEAHADSCGEPQVTSPVLPRPTTRHVKQTTLLTPRFRRSRVLSSSPSPEPATDWNQDPAAGYTEEEEEGEGGEEEGDEMLTGSCRSTRSTSDGPQMYECEGGGYQVDLATVSSSPIRSFCRITDLDPLERASYYNQFTKKERGKERHSDRGQGVTGYTSSRRGGGRGGGGRGRGGGGGRGGRAKGRGKRYYFKGRGKRN